MSFGPCRGRPQAPSMYSRTVRSGRPRSFLAMALLATFAIATAGSSLAQAKPLPSPPRASAPTQHPSRRPDMLVAGIVLAVAGAAAVVGVSVAANAENKNQSVDCSTPGACPSAFSFTVKDSFWPELGVFCLGTASFVAGVPLIVVGARRLASPDPAVPGPRSSVSWFSPSLVTVGARGPQLTLTVDW